MSTSVLNAQRSAFDVIIRNGTVIDGSGNPRFEADVAIRNGFIAAIGDLRPATAGLQVGGTGITPASGDLSQATAGLQIDATGLYVTPGFINIHSHASPDALATAVN